MIKDFYGCINEGRKFPIDAYEGGKAVEEFLAVYKSSLSGEAVNLKGNKDGIVLLLFVGEDGSITEL